MNISQLSITRVTGQSCPASGMWESLGNFKTTVFLAKGYKMPDYCGEKVVWKLVFWGCWVKKRFGMRDMRCEVRGDGEWKNKEHHLYLKLFCSKSGDVASSVHFALMQNEPKKSRLETPAKNHIKMLKNLNSRGLNFCFVLIIYAALRTVDFF